MALEYKSNIAEIIKNFESLDKEMQKELRVGFNDGMNRFVGLIQRHQMTGRKSQNYGLNIGHGALRQSWYVKKLEGRGLDIGFQIGTRSKYAAIHQFGGIINAKPGKALAIPIHPLAKRAKSPKEFSDLFMLTRKNGPPLLIRQVRRGGAAKVAGKVRPIIREDIFYVLKKSVRIPKRLFILESWKRQGPDVLLRAMWQRVESLRRVREMQKTSGT